MSVRVLSIDVGIKNLGVCDMSARDRWVKIHEWKVMGCAVEDNGIDGSIRGAVGAMSGLVEDAGGFVWDAVVIENQPCMKNPRMKAVQVAIHTFVAMRGDENTEVFLAAAAGKNRVADAVLGSVRGSSNKYKENKARSVSASRFLVRRGENSAWIRTLDSHPKKDDMCDAFMQGVYYLKERMKLIDIENFE